MDIERDPEDSDGQDHEEESSGDGVEDGQGEVVDDRSCLGSVPREGTFHDFLTYALSFTTYIPK
jgi:hypothetical protein